MRQIFLLLVLCAASATGCDGCNNAAMGTDDMEIDIDMYLWEHDGMLPPGVAPTDGGIVITTDAGTFTCFIATCKDKLYQCGDCIDNDGDGLVDSMDPDCLGPCQNNEAGFAGNIPGQNNAPCQADCFWDPDSGFGEDKCYWTHQCDPFQQGTADNPPGTAPEIGCTYNPNAMVPGAQSFVPMGQKHCDYLIGMQLPECINYCKPLTPNGCDCFGCCENPLNPGAFVFADSMDAQKKGTCTAATLNDPKLCKPCTPVTGCYNGCGRCQLCFGKTTLPPDCYNTPDGGAQDGGATPQECPAGEQACGLPGQPSCPSGTYCQSGCCATLIF
jgi:hypothetical protein